MKAVKLSQLISNLQKMKGKYGDLECIYSKDDEGNEHKAVAFSPTPMEIIKHWTGEIEILNDNIEDDNIKPNAMCIN